MLQLLVGSLQRFVDAGGGVSGVPQLLPELFSACLDGAPGGLCWSGFSRALAAVERRSRSGRFGHGGRDGQSLRLARARTDRLGGTRLDADGGLARTIVRIVVNCGGRSS